MNQKIGTIANTYLLLALFLFYAETGVAEETSLLSQGQDMYIPAYSHIYHGNKETPLLLSVTLSIRNIDLNNSITITKVDYHETEGALVKQFISEPQTLGPLGGCPRIGILFKIEKFSKNQHSHIVDIASIIS